MRYFYHPTEGARVFESDEKPDGWFYNPSEYGVYTAPSREQLEEIADRERAPAIPVTTVAESQSKDELIARADAAGIEIDKRWGVDRIKAAIDDHVNGDGT